MIIPYYLRNVGMGGGGSPTILFPVEEDKSVAKAFVEDYKPVVLKKTASNTRLFERQVKARKKMKIGEGKGKWFDRLVESNNMRAALLLAAT